MRTGYQSWFGGLRPATRQDGGALESRASPSLASQPTSTTFSRDCLLDSELGQIPDGGGRMMALGDICSKPQYGYTQSRSRRPCGTEVPFASPISMKMPWSVLWDSAPHSEISERDFDKYHLRQEMPSLLEWRILGTWLHDCRPPASGLSVLVLIRFRYAGQALRTPSLQPSAPFGCIFPTCSSDEVQGPAPGHWLECPSAAMISLLLLPATEC